MTNLPVVVVVGSPNAGKSTLVNRLSGSRAAVVHETPGVTRDRKEVEVEWEGRTLLMVDTGGYDTDPDAPFAVHIREQVQTGITAADLVLFVVDGRAGPVADDFEIADVLRRAKTPVVLVANKIDDPSAVAASQELYDLGLGEPHLVSAVHGLGTGDLLDIILEKAGDTGSGRVAVEETPGEIPVAIVGRPNAGKSTLLNRLTGSDVYAANELFATLDPTSRRLRFPEEREVVLIDTVGFIRDLPDTLKNAFRATLEELRDADLLLHVVDAADPRRRHQMDAVDDVLESLDLSATPRIVVLNKSDRIADEVASRGDGERERLHAVRTSALKGTGLDDLVTRMRDEIWSEGRTWPASPRDAAPPPA